jgi:hypothetical protein
MQKLINLVTGSKTSAKADEPKNATMSTDQISEMEKEALTSKSTVNAPSKDIDQLKNIIKETERLSLDEKPQMAQSAPETDQVEEQKMEVTPSKKRPFDQITNSEEKAK